MAVDYQPATGAGEDEQRRGRFECDRVPCSCQQRGVAQRVADGHRLRPVHRPTGQFRRDLLLAAVHPGLDNAGVEPLLGRERGAAKPVDPQVGGQVGDHLLGAAGDQHDREAHVPQSVDQRADEVEHLLPLPEPHLGHDLGHRPAGHVGEHGGEEPVGLVGQGRGLELVGGRTHEEAPQAGPPVSGAEAGVHELGGKGCCQGARDKGPVDVEHCDLDLVLRPLLESGQRIGRSGARRRQ